MSRRRLRRDARLLDAGSLLLYVILSILIIILIATSQVYTPTSLTKFDGGLLRLHEADEAAVDWLTSYGS